MRSNLSPRVQWETDRFRNDCFWCHYKSLPSLKCLLSFCLMVCQGTRGDGGMGILYQDLLAFFFFVFFFNCFSHEELLAIFPFISFQVYIHAERPIRLYFYISLTIQCSSLTWHLYEQYTWFGPRRKYGARSRFWHWWTGKCFILIQMKDNLLVVNVSFLHFIVSYTFISNFSGQICGGTCSCTC